MIINEGMMKFIFLTEQFYNDYKDCVEIEKKITRPYIKICIEVEGEIYAIPLRSNINHPHVYWTDKENKCGVDFSKAVVVSKEEYINNIDKPYIRPNEFKKLKGQEYFIKQKLISYISKYKKAKMNLDKEHNKILCKYSTLQYFEEYL